VRCNGRQDRDGRDNRRTESAIGQSSVWTGRRESARGETLTRGTVGHRQKGGGAPLGVMASAINVADAILKIAKAKGKSLTPLQLMKLVYIAHGWSLAIRGEDLFSDRIEAWKFGPVIPTLYHATKAYGKEPIPLSRIDDAPSGLDEDTMAFLEDVFEKYGNMTGYALSQLTHKPGTPWAQVYEDGIFNIEIPDSIIETHYKKLLDERRIPA
jgi:uncharacterized phage-associated protein